jgi:hypothetical protein
MRLGFFHCLHRKTIGQKSAGLLAELPFARLHKGVIGFNSH